MSRKTRRRVRANGGKAVTSKAVALPSATDMTIEGEASFSEMTMTERGYVPSEVAKAQAGGAVHTPQLMNLSSQQLPPQRGTRELLELYSNSPWLRAIVNKISRSVADTEWVLYAKKTGGKYVEPKDLVRRGGRIREQVLMREIENDNIDTILEHPMLDLLANGTGNPRLNGFAALQVTQSHLELNGEAFWLLETNGAGTPVAYWPMPPSWISAFPTENDPFWEIRMPGGRSIKVPASMVVPFIDPDPANPYARGSGIAKSLDDEIQIDEFAAKHAKSFFLNRARPDIIISGQFIGKKDAERLEKQWLADHQGFWKSFKPLFFSQKIDVKELSQSFESMQMVQIRKHERDTFVSVFGAPPEKFGIIGESKRSTIAAADYFWNKDLIKPRVEMIRRILQQVLVPRFDERIILYYDTPVIQDEEHKLNAMRQATWASTINEWRKVQGQESLGPAGDVLVVPVNMQLIPVTNNGQPLTAPDVAQESARQRERYVESGQGNGIESDSIVRNVVSEIVQELDLRLDARLPKPKEGYRD